MLSVHRAGAYGAQEILPVEQGIKITVHEESMQVLRCTSRSKEKVQRTHRAYRPKISRLFINTFHTNTEVCGQVITMQYQQHGGFCSPLPLSQKTSLITESLGLEGISRDHPV